MQKEREPVVYLYTNDKGDDVQVEWYPDTQHVRLIIDFEKNMDEKEVFAWALSCRYKLKKAPLRRVK